MRPIEIRNLTAARRMDIRWEDDTVTSVAHRDLRAHCRCSGCAARRRTTLTEPVDHDGVSIFRIYAVGHYGLAFEFSDGHARGIYPWAYLRELAAPDAETHHEMA
jgi:DUF971 family protein